MTDDILAALEKFQERDSRYTNCFCIYSDKKSCITPMTKTFRNKLKIIRSKFSNLDAEDFDLLTRKGVYEYIDSVDKLNETNLPPRELFYSSLTDETAFDDDYQHADIDMVMFVERGIRGGLYQCSHRYAQTNNKYNASSYDPLEPSTYLMYFDVNNLYGWAMSESLPYGEFQWVDDIERFDVMSVSRYVVYYRNLQQCIQHELHIVIGKSDTKRIKGVKKNVVTLHEVYTVSELKLALSPYDDKRYVISESVTTLPSEHYKIPL
ncbi:hypothetical protein ALC56_10596 [Trachymyrmex septentrionalis]|uniref:DNA-directed DNA polymerase n=1 Tax=Trachymyrmex septentrionalis TaxID=34720 RepID=A0A151JTQ7_9HYME|nr:hypothetical protein ALC56_10596 [Trachymyrmex septentrionalis]